MTDKLDGFVEQHINDVDSRLKGVDTSQREELLLDLRTHKGNDFYAEVTKPVLSIGRLS